MPCVLGGLNQLYHYRDLIALFLRPSIDLQHDDALQKCRSPKHIISDVFNDKLSAQLNEPLY